MSKPQIKRIGHELMTWRESENLSQSELAERAGVNQATISRVERGLSTSPQALHKLCTLAGVDVHKKDLAYAPELSAALDRVWDGSEEQAQTIAILLMAANSISNANSSK